MTFWHIETPRSRRRSKDVIFARQAHRPWDWERFRNRPKLLGALDPQRLGWRAVEQGRHQLSGGDRQLPRHPRSSLLRLRLARRPTLKRLVEAGSVLVLLLFVVTLIDIARFHTVVAG